MPARQSGTRPRQRAGGCRIRLQGLHEMSMRAICAVGDSGGEFIHSIAPDSEGMSPFDWSCKEGIMSDDETEVAETEAQETAVETDDVETTEEVEEVTEASEGSASDELDEADPTDGAETSGEAEKN